MPEKSLIIINIIFLCYHLKILGIKSIGFARKRKVFRAQPKFRARVNEQRIMDEIWFLEKFINFSSYINERLVYELRRAQSRATDSD